MRKIVFFLFLLSVVGVLTYCAQESSEPEKISIKSIPEKKANTAYDQEPPIQKFLFTIPNPHEAKHFPDLQLVFFSTSSEIVDLAYQKARDNYLSLTHKWFSWRESKGLLKQVNEALKTGEWMWLEPMDLAYLHQLKKLSLQSADKFNPTIGYIQQLWGFSNYPEGSFTRSPPATKELNKALSYRVNQRALVFKKPAVRSENEQVQLDLYSTFQGYLIERIFASMSLFPAIQWANIRLGNSRKIFNPEGNFIYPISTDELAIESSTNVTFYLCHNQALTLLDKRAKSITYQSKQYHYIIDPQTARPVQTFLDKVLVFGGNAVQTEATALATFMADEHWRKLHRDMNINHAVVVKNKDQLQLSEPLNRWLKNTQDKRQCLNHS